MRNYNIPSNNRELQQEVSRVKILLIITYQVITGNYSEEALIITPTSIITYQVITGNYSELIGILKKFLIITYQVITGNYSSVWESFIDDVL